MKNLITKEGGPDFPELVLEASFGGESSLQKKQDEWKEQTIFELEWVNKCV